MEKEFRSKGRHKKVSSMVIENLEESLYIAEKCLLYRKKDPNIWSPPHALGGCLGHPAFAILMSIIDSLSGFMSGNKKYPVEINLDGKTEILKYVEGWKRFKILNSKYFGLNLKEKDIKAVYLFGRNKIHHNASLGEEIQLFAIGNKNYIIIDDKIEGKGKIKIYLPTLYKKCKEVVSELRDKFDDIIDHSIHSQEFKSKNSYKK